MSPADAKRMAKEKELRHKKREEKKEADAAKQWNKYVNYNANPEAKYVKMSDRTLKPPPGRSKSTLPQQNSAVKRIKGRYADPTISIESVTRVGLPKIEQTSQAADRLFEMF